MSQTLDRSLRKTIEFYDPPHCPGGPSHWRGQRIQTGATTSAGSTTAPPGRESKDACYDPLDVLPWPDPILPPFVRSATCEAP